MFKQSALINTLVEHTKTRISADQVERFADVVAGPACSTSIPLVAFASLGNMEKVYQLLDIKAKQLLHSRETIECIELPSAEDELDISVVITDLYEQQASSNPIGFAVVDVIGKKKGVFIFCVTRTFAIRGGFSRG